MKTMQQQRARFALTAVRRIKNEKENDKYFSEFKSYSSSLAPMIHMNGLGQAAAFYKAKKGTHRDIYDILSNWLTSDNQPYQGREELIDGIVDGDMRLYRLAQAEAQVFLDWLKLFAKAEMVSEGMLVNKEEN